MPSTPRRKVSSEQTHSPAQSLIGCSVAIPANIFKESNSHFTGKVVGTPRRKNAVYVKVDQDNTEYWFPTDEVAKWVVKDDKTAATLATPKTPKRARRALHQDIANDASTAASSQPTARAKRSKKQAATEGDQHKTPALLDSQPQHVHDAASCHPERPEDLTETIEGLVSDCCKAANVPNGNDDRFQVVTKSIPLILCCRQPQVLKRFKLSESPPLG